MTYGLTEAERQRLGLNECGITRPQRQVVEEIKHKRKLRLCKLPGRGD